jgi:hypothetical protein
MLIRLKSLHLLKKHKQAYANFISMRAFRLLHLSITYYINKEYSFILFLSSNTGTLDYIYYKQKTHINLSSLSGFIASFVLVLSCIFRLHISNIKQENKYKALAENLSSGDMMDGIFFLNTFREMTEKLYKDEELQKIAAKKRKCRETNFKAI